jgi:hypothetical protein
LASAQLGQASGIGAVGFCAKAVVIICNRQRWRSSGKSAWANSFITQSAGWVDPGANAVKLSGKAFRGAVFFIRHVGEEPSLADQPKLQIQWLVSTPKDVGND